MFWLSKSLLFLRISWAKTKLQNVGAGSPPTTLSLDGATVEGVEQFIYLGSKQSSSGYCRPDMLRRVGLASSVMSSLQSTVDMEMQLSQHEH